eukprot:960387_1
MSSSADSLNGEREELESASDLSAISEFSLNLSQISSEARTTCDTPSKTDMSNVLHTQQNYDTWDLKYQLRNSYKRDGTIVKFKCAPGFKKGSESEYIGLTCVAKTNSWSMTGTTCIPDPKFCE